MTAKGFVPKLKRWSWRTAKLLAAAAVAGGIVYWLKFSPVPVREHRIEVDNGMRPAPIRTIPPASWSVRLKMAKLCRR